MEEPVAIRIMKTVTGDEIRKRTKAMVRKYRNVFDNLMRNRMKEKSLIEIHDCPKCHGKMVLISVDMLGNTYCGYCHERVDYWKLKEEWR